MTIDYDLQYFLTYNKIIAIYIEIQKEKNVKNEKNEKNETKKNSGNC